MVIIRVLYLNIASFSNFSSSRSLSSYLIKPPSPAVSWYSIFKTFCEGCMPHVFCQWVTKCFVSFSSTFFSPKAYFYDSSGQLQREEHHQTRLWTPKLKLVCYLRSGKNGIHQKINKIMQPANTPTTTTTSVSLSIQTFHSKNKKKTHFSDYWTSVKTSWLIRMWNFVDFLKELIFEFFLLFGCCCKYKRHLYELSFSAMDGVPFMISEKFACASSDVSFSGLSLWTSVGRLTW